MVDPASEGSSLQSKVLVGKLEQVGSANSVLIGSETLSLITKEFDLIFEFTGEGESSPNVQTYAESFRTLHVLCNNFDYTLGITWASVIGTLDDGREMSIRIYTKTIKGELHLSRFVHVDVFAGALRADKV